MLRHGRGIVWLVALAVMAAMLPVSASAADAYETYENSNVCFALEYPAGYEVSEPYENGVYIRDGDSMRFMAEYTWHTAAEDCAFYSAGDFAGLMENDRQVLADWLGTDNFMVTDSGWVDGDSYRFAFSMSESGQEYTGQLTLIEGQCAYGCYAVQWAVRTDDAKAEQYKQQCAHMQDSFRVTGRYQPSDFAYYSYTVEDTGMEFILREGLNDFVELKGDGEYVSIHPEEGVYSEAWIVIDRSVYEVAEDTQPSEVLEGLCKYFFDYYDETAYTSQVGQFDLGRHTHYSIGLSYKEDGEPYNVTEVIFPYAGYYWEAYATYTDEYADEIDTAMGDILFSLRLNAGEFYPDLPAAKGTETRQSASVSAQPDPGASEDGQTALAAAAGQIVDQISSRPGFRDNDGFMEPLAIMADVNGDGVWEFMAVYEVQDSGGVTRVYYDLWNVRSDGPEEWLSNEILYTEVGGNSGQVGLAKRDGQFYLMTLRSSPDGDMRNDTYSFIPLGDMEGYNPRNEIKLTVNGFYGGETHYFVSDSVPLSPEEYEAEMGAFEIYYVLDIQEGPGGSVVALSDFA